jgi:hypothetical protein
MEPDLLHGTLLAGFGKSTEKLRWKHQEVLLRMFDSAGGRSACTLHGTHPGRTAPKCITCGPIADLVERPKAAFAQLSVRCHTAHTHARRRNIAGSRNFVV